MLELKHVAKSFNGEETLKEISFSVKKEEFVAIIGPSGCGKSTLFSLIGGILTPDQGKIYKNGRSINGKPGFVSYMPQQATLLPWRTSLDNALLGQELAQKLDQKLTQLDKEMAKAMLVKAGLGEVIKYYPHQLSGGMQQRVSFIRALLSPQDLLCLDEPFSALDELTRLEMQKWLLEVWSESKRSILFITHNIEEALFLSDKIVVLSPSPTQVKKIYSIPFPRPRKESLFFNSAFLSLKEDLLKVIRASSL